MYQRILVPIDGSVTSDRGLDAAIDIARLTRGSLRLVHVIDQLVFATGFEPGATYERDVLPQIRRRAAALLEAARARVAAAGVAVDTVMSECFARRTADVVLEAAKEWKADLIVIGTHGRRGVSRLFLGSDAEQVLRSAEVPVLLVRNDKGDDASAVAAPVAQAVARSAAATA